MARAALPCALPALATVLAAAGPARAEGDRALTVTAGWATFSAPGEAEEMMEPVAIGPDLGGALGVAYEHMLSSELGLRGELVGAVFRGGNTEDQPPTSYAGVIDAGVVFRFDVLKYVPYAFAGLGAIASGGGPLGGLDPALVLGGGLDVLASRERSWGVEFRLASFGGDITVVTLGLRATTRWGYL